MIVTVQKIEDFPLPSTSAGRSPGLHVSSIIRLLAMERGILAADEMEELSLIDVRDMSRIGIVAQLRIHLGLAWEEHYLRQLLDVEKHPGELKLDGVYLSPDGESFSVIFTLPGKWGVIIHEVKCTYKSTNTTTARGKVLEGRKNFLWMCQLKSYCKAKGTRFGVLHVLHVCGDYVRPIVPMLYRYHIEFTQQELDDNWNLLMDYRDIKIMEGVDA